MVVVREHPHTTSDFLGGRGVKPPIFYMLVLIKVSDEGGGGVKKGGKSSDVVCRRSLIFIRVCQNFDIAAPYPFFRMISFNSEFLDVSMVNTSPESAVKVVTLI